MYLMRTFAFFTHRPVSTFDRVPFRLTVELFTWSSAAASVALCEGVVGPLIVRVVRAAGGGGKRGERFAAFESESESDRESDHAHVGARGGGRGGSRKTR
jgi:hypothetical protein